MCSGEAAAVTVVAGFDYRKKKKKRLAIHALNFDAQMSFFDSEGLEIIQGTR